MTPAAFDFRKPPPGDLERQIGGWFTIACRRAAGAWPKLLCYPAELKPGPVDTVPSTTGLRAIPEDAIGVLLSPPSSADGAILLAIRRPLLLALLSGLLGETPTDLPADRDPTEIEGSLVGYLIRELFVDSLERGWPAAEPLQLTPGKPGSPRAAWTGPGTDMVLLATPTITGPFGEHPIHLILTRTGRWERLSRLALPAPSAEPTNREQIAALVTEMKVDLAVVLGTAELTMSEVARLKAGDLVVLRQKVTDPLDGLVAGARKFRVWPGAVGTRAAGLIHTSTED
jgi:flagellar motor switch protein FliM